MKRLFIFPLNLLLSAAVFSQTQTGYQVIIRVIDADTDKPVQGVLVSLKEKGWQTEKADANGKVVFKDVMSRDINFTATADGYLRAEENKNVAEQQESNTFEIKLKKPSAERVLIVGEVTDANGKDVEGATVEFKLVNILKETKTDASGNYMIEVDLNELKVSSSEGELEVKKGDCKVKEKILVGQKSILKDLKLDCQKKTVEPTKVLEKQPEKTTSPLGNSRGHICIKNLTNVSFYVFVHNKETKAEVGRLSLNYRQQEEKCVYNLKPGVYYYVGGDYGIYTGEVLVEAGKTQTVHIR